MNRLSSKELLAFEEYLREEEKSDATVEKYLRDVRCFYAFLANRSAEKSEVLAYKEYLSQQYAPASVNSMLVALNGFLRFCGLSHCCVKLLKIQRQMFCRQEKELTREEYRRLVNAAKVPQLSHILQTICGTGIRVSELQYGGELQKQDAGDFHPRAAAETAGKIYKKGRPANRAGVCRTKRQTARPQLYLAYDEGAVRKSQRGAEQGIPP